MEIAEDNCKGILIAFAMARDFTVISIHLTNLIKKLIITVIIVLLINVLRVKQFTSALKLNRSKYLTY